MISTVSYCNYDKVHGDSQIFGTHSAPFRIPVKIGIDFRLRKPYSVAVSTGLLHFLDIFFIVFHTTFTLFNIFGWIWRKTRKLHLITLLLTLFSWIVLGIWYGFGYCFCTDWHWQVRAMLGNPPTENGYIQFLVRILTGLRPSYELTAKATIIVTVLLLAATLFFNGRDFLRWRLRRKNERELNLMDEEPQLFIDDRRD